MILGETQLEVFRREHLAPEAVLALIEEHRRVLLRLAVGVGKSWLCDELLAWPSLYEAFDLVVYAAPAWNILHERRIVSGETVAPVPMKVLEGRPLQRCGSYAEEWESLQSRGCVACAKKELCGPCTRCDVASGVDPCPFPTRMRGLRRTRLLFLAEQQFSANRSLLPLLQLRTGARRPLVILDEGHLLDSRFDVMISAEALERFREVLLEAPLHRRFEDDRSVGIEMIDRLLREGRGALTSVAPFPDGLNWQALAIQKAGIRRFGRAFRYLGYELSHLGRCRTDERWKEDSGDLRFIARPFLHCHLLVLSAHTTARFARHRLGIGSIYSPFEDYRFVHSGTRIYNVRNRAGADKHFRRSSERILDAFAVVLLANVLEGHSTVLVSRKKHKAFCADRLRERLAGWGMDVTFVTEGYGALPRDPDPRTIPLIHYGLLGVNAFEHYESLYCLNSYYVPEDELNRCVQECEPEHFKTRLTIDSEPDHVRRVRIDRSVPALEDREWLGETYLRRLEVDPVIQAAGRVRFATQPREVVLFQMSDLSADLPSVREVVLVGDLLEELGLPSARDLDGLAQALRIEELLQDGHSSKEAAAVLGISERTLYYRRRERETLESAANTAKKRYNIYITFFCSVGVGLSDAEAVL